MSPNRSIHRGVEDINEAHPLLGNQNLEEEINKSRKKGLFAGLVLGLMIMAIVLVVLNLPWSSRGTSKNY